MGVVVGLYTKGEWASRGDWVPVGMRLLPAGLPGMTGNLLCIHWQGESRAAEPRGQGGRLVGLELHDAGGVADEGRAGLMVEVAHRDSVWHITE